MTTVEALRKARGLIAEEDRWCQSASARDSGGGPCAPNHPKACQWCLTAAVRVAADDDDTRWKCNTRLRAAVAEMFGLSEEAQGVIVHFNDEATHAEVLRVLDRATLHEETFA